MVIKETLAVNVCSVPSPCPTTRAVSNCRCADRGHREQRGQSRENGKPTPTMTMRLCRLLPRRPLTVSLCQLIVALPLVILLLHRPLMDLSCQLVVALPFAILSLRHPLVLSSSSSRRASLWSHCLFPLLVLSLRHPLVLSSRRLVVALPLDVPPS